MWYTVAFCLKKQKKAPKSKDRTLELGKLYPNQPQVGRTRSHALQRWLCCMHVKTCDEYHLCEVLTHFLRLAAIKLYGFSVKFKYSYLGKV